MTTMLEKAARAMYARKYGDHDPWDEAAARMARLGMNRLANNQAEAVADARAALEAIREPSEEVAAVAKYDEYDWAARNFTAMIDAILNEKTP